MSWSTEEFYRPSFTHNLLAVHNSASALLSWALVSRNMALQQHISRIIIRKMTCAQLGKIIFSAYTYVKVMWMVAPLFSPWFTLEIRTTNETWKTATLLWEIRVLSEHGCRFKCEGEPTWEILSTNPLLTALHWRSTITQHQVASRLPAEGELHWHSLPTLHVGMSQVLSLKSLKP